MIDLVNNKNFIAGRWVEQGNDIAVDNPANGKIVGYIPKLNSDEIKIAIDNTVEMADQWAKTTIDQRYDILRKWYDLQFEFYDDLAKLITLEQGKVLSEAKGEMAYGCSYIEWFTCQMKSQQGYIRPGNNINHKIIAEKQPIGPVAAITPWNFPFAMIARKITPALAAGCSVLLKPSELTPFSALIQGYLLEKAGLPGGVLNIITGDPEEIGNLICDDFRIRKISFTGSTRVGKILYNKSSESLKKLSLELGGNAPYIIFPDIDIDKVSDDLVKIKLRSGGQSCTSPNRIFIHEDIYDKFVKLLTNKFSKCKAGDGFAQDSQIGSLINKAAIDKITTLLAEANNQGAKIATGGIANGNFFQPTVIYDCHDQMDIFSTEIFGPVLACYSFAGNDEVIKRANNTEYGLQSYLYSKDMQRANYVASYLKFGMVSINSSTPATPKAPFAGIKASGFGIEGSNEGIDEYYSSKYINYNY